MPLTWKNHRVGPSDDVQRGCLELTALALWREVRRQAWVLNVEPCCDDGKLERRMRRLERGRARGRWGLEERTQDRGEAGALREAPDAIEWALLVQRLADVL